MDDSKNDNKQQKYNLYKQRKRGHHKKFPFYNGLDKEKVAGTIYNLGRNNYEIKESILHQEIKE